MYALTAAFRSRAVAARSCCCPALRGSLGVFASFRRTERLSAGDQVEGKQRQNQGNSDSRTSGHIQRDRDTYIEYRCSPFAARMATAPHSSQQQSQRQSNTTARRMAAALATVASTLLLATSMVQPAAAQVSALHEPATGQVMFGAWVQTE